MGSFGIWEGQAPAEETRKKETLEETRKKNLQTEMDQQVNLPPKLQCSQQSALALDLEAVEAHQTLNSQN